MCWLGPALGPRWARGGPGPGPGPAWARPGPDPSRENQVLGIRSNMTSGDVLDGLE